MQPTLCFIKADYFIEHLTFSKLLDAGNSNKQSRRTHLCVKIKIDNNNYYIPLRNNLGDEVRKYGRIGHSIPSSKRPSAGLDFRYALIINDYKYIEKLKRVKIPRSQYNKISTELDIIREEFSVYVRGYIKAFKKGRHIIHPLYRESSLINFVKYFK